MSEEPFLAQVTWRSVFWDHEITELVDSPSDEEVLQIASDLAEPTYIVDSWTSLDGSSSSVAWEDPGTWFEVDLLVETNGEFRELSVIAKTRDDAETIASTQFEFDSIVALACEGTTAWSCEKETRERLSNDPTVSPIWKLRNG